MSFAVRVAAYEAAPLAREAVIGVAIADPALAATVTAAIAEAVAAACAVGAAGVAGAAGAVCAAGEGDASAPVVRVRSRKGVARRAGELAGAIAIVPVTERNARHLIAIVDGVRAAGALGVQLVWDGALPPRARIEAPVFAALEHARATPAAAPVVLAAADVPASALQLLIAHRRAARRDSR